MQILPNFFPHVYTISLDELPKVKDGKFKEIFVHFDDTENSLGLSSNNNRAYKGKYGQRPIAIKKISLIALKTDKNDICLMLQSDIHENVLKFFGLEVDKEFIYIGMELCICNLATFIKSQDLRQKLPTKTIFHQTAEGFNYLHQLNISEYCSFSSSVSKLILKFQFLATSNQKIF